MPIRMEQDSPNQRGGDKNKNQGGNRGGIIALLLAALVLLRNPRLLVPLLIVGAVWYFFLGGKNVLSGTADPDSQAASPYSLGATLSQEQFDKAQVFAALSSSYGNRLPARVSLEEYAPQRLQQGVQGSCVGWASAYAARTILQARATGKDPDQLAFSPSYLYNQIHLQGCQGAYMIDAMKTMSTNGAVPFETFGYDERSCSAQPSQRHIQLGRQYLIKGYNRLTKGSRNYGIDISAIKQNLAQGAPVVIGMMVGGSFMNAMRGREVWRPTQRDYSMAGFGGHAMCVIGYDDNLEGGAFQIMNSWGESWGDRGMAWVRYRDFEHFTKEAYGLHPMGSADDKQFDDSKMAVEFGLLDIEKQTPIRLKSTGDIVFRTVQPLRKGETKFKVLIANSIECYVYIFGQETDGTSYVLFPYNEKYSPYCGITGTRLFPNDLHMTPDDIGDRDFIAIIVSKEELDYNVLNQAITQAPGTSYAQKVKSALGDTRSTDTSFAAGNTISFESNVEDAPIVATVIAMDKQ